MLKVSEPPTRLSASWQAETSKGLSMGFGGVSRALSKALQGFGDFAVRAWLRVRIGFSGVRV